MFYWTLRLIPTSPAQAAVGIRRGGGDEFMAPQEVPSRRTAAGAFAASSRAVVCINRARSKVGSSLVVGTAQVLVQTRTLGKTWALEFSTTAM
jgi:hypothetical protein